MSPRADSPAIDQTPCISARAFQTRQASAGLFNAVAATFDLAAIVTTTTSDDEDDENDGEDYVDAVDTSPHTLQEAIDHQSQNARHGSAFTRLMFKTITTEEDDDELTGQCPEIDRMLAAMRGGPRTPPPSSLLPPPRTHPSPRRSSRKAGMSEDQQAGETGSVRSYTTTLVNDAASFTSGKTFVNHRPLPPSSQNVLDEPFVVLEGDISILHTPISTPRDIDGTRAHSADIQPPEACRWDTIEQALNKLSDQHNVTRSSTTKVCRVSTSIACGID